MNQVAGALFSQSKSVPPGLASGGNFITYQFSHTPSVTMWRPSSPHYLQWHPPKKEYTTRIGHAYFVKILLIISKLFTKGLLQFTIGNGFHTLTFLSPFQGLMFSLTLHSHQLYLALLSSYTAFPHMLTSTSPCGN